MKTKKFEKKLNLKKITVSSLNVRELNSLHGGDFPPDMSETGCISCKIASCIYDTSCITL